MYIKVILPEWDYIEKMEQFIINNIFIKILSREIKNLNIIIIIINWIRMFIFSFYNI